MPPEGKVGISPVCILGVNINKGQEISLRLRTDDLKGGLLAAQGGAAGLPARVERRLRGHALRCSPSAAAHG